jgi:O-antigen/teichoic acid export membrane protein
MNFFQYTKNVSLLFVINFAIKPIWVFVIDNKFQQVLGNDVFGNYFSYLSLIYIFSVVLDFGLHNYTVKSIAEKKESYTEILSELWMSKFILISLYLSIVLCSIWIQQLNYEQGKIFFLVSVEMLIFSLYQFLRCFAQGLQLLRLDSILSSLDRISLIISGLGIIVLMSYSSIDIYTYIYFHLIAYSICFLGVWFYLKSKISFKFNTFSTHQLKLIVASGWPLIIIILLMSIYSRMDVVLLKNMLADGNVQCGIFANSNRLVDSAYNTLALLSVFLLPTIAFQFTEKNFANIRKLVLSSVLISSIMSLGFIGFCLFFSELIYLKLFNTSDIFSIQVFRIHVWSTLGVGWMYVMGSYLTATGRYRILIGIVAIGVVMSLGLNYFFIPSHKALGVAYTSAIVQLTMGVLHILAASYYLFKIDKP